MVLPSSTPDHPLGNTQEVSALLAESINQLRRGELDPRVANGIGYLTSILLLALEHRDEERLANAKSQLYAKRLYLPLWRREIIERLQCAEQESLKTGLPVKNVNAADVIGR